MRLRPVLAWALLGVALLLLLSGFGITYPGLVGPFTLGLLGKASSQVLHTLLWGPFLLLLLLHVRRIG